MAAAQGRARPLLGIPTTRLAGALLVSWPVPFICGRVQPFRQFKRRAREPGTQKQSVIRPSATVAAALRTVETSFLGSPSVLYIQTSTADARGVIYR
jgi:hypothetical protein